MAKFDAMMEWLARTYVHAMNCIHYMHDKYYYERLEMALHDRDILRTMAFGIAGLSVVADSLVRDQAREGEADPARGRARRRLRDDGRFPACTATTTTGSTASRPTSCRRFMKKIRKHPTYRNAVHTQSVLTITSNVVYGKNTGDTPDGRKAGEPFAPGRQPDARPRQPRLAGVLPVGRQAALRGCAGRHQLHRLGRAEPQPAGSGARRSSRR